MILISILGVAMDGAMRVGEKRLIPWRGKG